MLIGTLEEPLPDVTEEKKAALSTPPAWSYCWLQHLNYIPDRLIQLFLVPQGTIQLYDCWNCSVGLGFSVRDLDDPFYDQPMDKNGIITKEYLLDNATNKWVQFRIQWKCKYNPWKIKKCTELTQHSNWMGLNRWKETNYTSCAEKNEAKCRYRFSGSKWEYTKSSQVPKIKWGFPPTDIIYQFEVVSVEDEKNNVKFGYNVHVDVSIQDHPVFKFE